MFVSLLILRGNKKEDIIQPMPVDDGPASPSVSGSLAPLSPSPSDADTVVETSRNCHPDDQDKSSPENLSVKMMKMKRIWKHKKKLKIWFMTAQCLSACITILH